MPIDAAPTAAPTDTGSLILGEVFVPRICEGFSAVERGNAIDQIATMRDAYVPTDRATILYVWIHSATTTNPLSGLVERAWVFDITDAIPGRLTIVYRALCACGCGAELVYDETCSNCHKTNDCCECRICARPNCREVVESVCDHCDRCRDCCECIICGNCGARGESVGFCETCEGCTHEDGGCCECEPCEHCGECIAPGYDCECNALTRITRPLRKYPAAKGPQVHNDLTRLIGVEIEIAAHGDAAAITRATRLWNASIVPDGSLPSGGSEIVTQPAAGDQWHAMIKDLACSLVGSKITGECGLHIHIDAGDFGPWDVRRLIQAYAAIEPALFQCVPEARRGSHYCAPCGEKYLAWIAHPDKGLKTVLHKKQYGGERGDRERNRLSKEKFDMSRYNALNLHSYWLRGTVEFRLGAGSIRREKIYHWGLVCAALVEYSAVVSQSELDGTLNAYAGQPWGLLKYIVGRMCRPETLAWLIARKDALS